MTSRSDHAMRLFACLTACWVLVETARGEHSAAQKITSIEGITEYRLDNGLKILLFPDPSRPTVTVNLTVFVGSRHEGYGETGMAHLLEHMLFKGTPTHANIPKLLQERGARYNGTTWLDRTNYFETLAAGEDNLEFAIRLEADRMVNSYVKRDDLLSEFSVVRNEFEMGENSPTGILSQRMTAVAYEWHNYGKSTIGNRSDIERVPIERLQAFYRKYYQPDNAMVVIAGRFEPATAIEIVVNTFGAIPKPTRVLEKTYTEEPPQDGERMVTLRRVGDVGVVGAIYHVPAGSHPEFAAVEVLADMLEAPPSGILYQALVETKKAASVSAVAYSLHDPGIIEIQAEVRKEQPLDEVRDILIQTLEGLGSKPIDPRQVERAKQRILKQRELAQADTSRIAVELSDWAAQGDWRLYFLHRDRVEKVTPDQVQEVAARYLRRSNRTLGLFIPTTAPERVPIPATVDLAKVLADYKGRQAVSAGEAFDVTPTAIESRTERVTLPSGIKAALLPKKNRGEAVTVTLSLHYGSKDTLRGFEAAANLMPTLMTRGTKSLSRQQIQDELDKNRARLNASGDIGELVLTIETKRDNLAKVLELARQILREPVFPANEFEILKRENLARLEQSQSEPQALASRRLQRLLSPYPKDDVRYEPTIEEEIERVKQVTRDQIGTLYRDYLGGQHGEIAIVGDFDRSETMNELARIFSDWKAPQAYARIERPALPASVGLREKILTPDKANAIYLAGLQLSLRDDHPEYAALVIGNHIMGGGALSSRLGDRLRQKDGLSYGAGSMLNVDSQDPRATWMLFAIANPDNMKRVEVGVDEEVARLLKDGVSGDEVAKAKQGYLKQLQVRRTNDRALAAQLGSTLELGRTMAYYEQLETRIDALTPEEVTAALRKHFNPKQLNVIMAGDFGDEKPKP